MLSHSHRRLYRASVENPRACDWEIHIVGLDYSSYQGKPDEYRA